MPEWIGVEEFKLTIIYSYIFVSMKTEKISSSTLLMKWAILQLPFSLNGFGIDLWGSWLKCFECHDFFHKKLQESEATLFVLSLFRPWNLMFQEVAEVTSVRNSARLYFSKHISTSLSCGVMIPEFWFRKHHVSFKFLLFSPNVFLFFVMKT